MLRRWAEPGAQPRGVVITDIVDELYREVEPHLARLLTRRSPEPPAIVLAGRPIRTLPKGIDEYCTGTMATHTARTLARYAHARRYDRVFLFTGQLNGWSPIHEVLRVEVELRHLNPRADVRYVIGSSPQLADGRALDDLLDDAAFRAGEGRHWQNLLGKYGERPLSAMREFVKVVDGLEAAFGSLPRPALWVFSSDDDAAAALEYCRTMRIGVPDDVAMIGLENSPRRLHLGISSCVPDWRTMGYLMAHAILRDMPVARTSHGFLRPSVRIYERDTTL
jgi:hypothetical protein